MERKFLESPNIVKLLIVMSMVVLMAQAQSNNEPMEDYTIPRKHCGEKIHIAVEK